MINNTNISNVGIKNAANKSLSAFFHIFTQNFIPVAFLKSTNFIHYDMTEHEKRYLKLAENIKSGAVWKREATKSWQCRNCGAIVEGDGAPEKCPVCAHPKAYFQLMADNF